MKNLKKQLLTALFLIGSFGISYSQSLVIKGGFCNKKERSMQANYTLRADTTRVAQGSAKHINIKLELNKIYTLSVSKPGFQTKDIHFSTFANYGDDFEFNFLVLLVESQIKNTVYKRKNYRLAGQVFYDFAKKDFDYFIVAI